MSRSSLLSAALLAVTATAHAGDPGTRTLLQRSFDPRAVVQVEVGDFHFTPGQPAPVHTHLAPVFGYVSKGTILYQIEGEAPQTLKTGDAFYEPVGLNILHFDNASQTDEAVFTDFNFERAGEPFIVFPKPLTTRIDRRSFPSETLDGAVADHMEVRKETLPPAAKLGGARTGERVTAYVADGSIRVRIGREAPIVYLTGQSFYVPNEGQEIVNASAAQSATVITFRLSNDNK